MSIARVSARALWEREVRAGLHGQDRQRPGTWVNDGLWLAACWEAAAADDLAQSRAATDRGDLRMGRVHLESASNKQAKADHALAAMFGNEDAAA